MTAVVVAAIAMACAPAAEAPTPTVGNLEAVRDGETEVLLARVTVGGTAVGFALSCDGARPLMTVYLGPFPAQLQALQLTNSHLCRRGDPIRGGVPRRRGERVPQPPARR